MISGYLIGDKELVARIGRVPTLIMDNITATVHQLGYQLEATVKHDWLRGPRPARLGIRTGRLAGSVATRFDSGPGYSYAYVGTNVPYGIMWETTGKRAYDVVPIRAKALRFEIDGEILFRKRVHIPAQAPRPFLKPALAQMRPVIIEQITKALTDAVATIAK